MKCIWVAGSKGQLGREIERNATNFDFRFVFTDIEELDLTNNAAVQEFALKERPDFIINCAAYTAVDKAESEPEQAFLINCKVPEILAQAAQQTNAILIHVSTDYVFDGTANEPYTEDAPTNPKSVYGKSKLCGEQKVLANPSNMVIRTAWLYSVHGTNFVKTMIRLGKERDELGVVADQYGSPTSASDLAHAIVSAVQVINQSDKNYGGIYHYSNEGSCNWAEFAKEIMKIAQLNCTINPITTADYPTPAKRPAYSLMSNGKVKTTFGIEVPYWKKSLMDVIANLT